MTTYSRIHPGKLPDEKEWDQIMDERERRLPGEDSRHNPALALCAMLGVCFGLTVIIGLGIVFAAFAKWMGWYGAT